MPIKTYETIGILNRYFIAHIDGREVSIRFANGTLSPRHIQGRYSTSDAKVQEWLETNGNFNKKFRLVSTVLTPDEKRALTAAAVDPEDDKAKTGVTPKKDSEVDDDLAALPGSIMEDTDEDILPDPDIEVTVSGGTVIVGEEVVNGQQARNYLMEHVKGLTFRQVGNNQQIIDVAKANNIQFTHWDAFVTAK